MTVWVRTRFLQCVQICIYYIYICIYRNTLYVCTLSLFIYFYTPYLFHNDWNYPYFCNVTIHHVTDIAKQLQTEFRLLWAPRLYIWDRRKLLLLVISWLWRDAEPRNCRSDFLFVLECTVSIFRFVNVYFFVRKFWIYTINRWGMVYAMCASAVISPLNQLGSCAEIRLKRA